MLHPLTDKWPYQYYKTFIIYNKESMLSRWSANKAHITTKRCGIEAELFNGVHKDNHAQEMEKDVVDAHINLYVNGFSISIGKEGKKAVEMVFEKVEKETNNIFVGE